ncbi:DUF6119 family protein [Mucilaginibacter phyllosphaerae]|uniref:Sporadically distributed protein, TIGR04141 family n=1 Tax=Mucilaginibacter phyllosphaerae TaxID=1812349 RepID=A0A4Y8AAZ6_9SPHI|nr:DUF6119 family protein [Mucilaginibacter phyllosphaerae]MBB3969632.1 hypothetical protein [Mucilaginibacter phyllosphaerae]TEW65019.1 hypothetical protein E2R65_13955 [Mucilaginibacter phyllosphaerae]GGH18492.1 hypothetical protein GCM10007352_29250 [Mucilaginibacter phyllosphaerae]
MKIVPNIFRIEKSQAALQNLTNTEEIVKYIITQSYKKREKSIDEQALTLTQFQKDDYTYFLYVYRTNDIESDWSKFLPSQLKDTSVFAQSKVNLVLFIDTEFDLFTIVGGSAYWIVASYMDHLFGLVTYDRIISLENDEAVSTKSRRMTGYNTGVSEQFRDDYRMMNYLQFGKIPKELHVRLSADTSFSHFNFVLAKPLEKLQIAVGKGFKVNKEVDFDTLHRLINELCIIMSMAPKDLLSSYIEVRDSQYLIQLKGILTRKIYNNIPVVVSQSKDPNDAFEFDFCNPNKIEEFYEAEYYDLVERTESNRKKDGLFATVRDKNEIYSTVIRRAYELNGNNENGILFYLYGVSVQCYVGKRQTAAAGFMYHFNAEFSVGSDAVFLVDSKWYRLKQSFIESLIAQTERILRNTKLTHSILHFPWTFDTVKKQFDDEGEYNMQYNGLPNYFVFDTIIVDGIELCDILYVSGNELYLIHVKHSFTSRVRELTNQILISARRLREAITAKQRSFFDKLYDGLSNKQRSTNGLSSDDFYNLFLLKKPVYVFATASQLAIDLPIENNMDKYDSNIARFSLTTCSGEMQTNYYDLKTYQIVRA